MKAHIHITSPPEKPHMTHITHQPLVLLLLCCPTSHLNMLELALVNATQLATLVLGKHYCRMVEWANKQSLPCKRARERETGRGDTRNSLLGFLAWKDVGRVMPASH